MVLIIHYVSGFTKPRFKSWLHAFGSVALDKLLHKETILVPTSVHGCEEDIVSIYKVAEQCLVWFYYYQYIGG